MLNPRGHYKLILCRYSLRTSLLATTSSLKWNLISDWIEVLYIGSKSISLLPAQTGRNPFTVRLMHIPHKIGKHLWKWQTPIRLPDCCVISRTDGAQFSPSGNEIHVMLRALLRNVRKFARWNEMFKNVSWFVWAI